MQKFYLLSLLLATFAFSGCSKDFLKRYEKRIEGTWDLIDVDRNGVGGSITDVPFGEGRFVFSEKGDLEYTESSGQVFKGSWDIRRGWISGRCYTDDNGSNNCDDRDVKSLHLTAVDFTNQDVKSEFFDEIIFTGTNRFKAYVYSGIRSYVFRFRRQ